MQDMDRVVWMVLGGVGCAAAEPSDRPETSRERLTEPSSGMGQMRVQVSTFTVGGAGAPREGRPSDTLWHRDGAPAG